MLDILPPALHALAAYRQFIVYRLTPSKDRLGKLDKKPIDHRDGAVANPHDPQIWTDFNTASNAAKSRGTSYGVGFVFTQNDPFFFVDIDDCLEENGTWSPIANELCTLFNGAAIEISSSLKGLHIFGRGKVPPHSCKNAALKLEFYTSGRFVALTGNGVIGNASYDCSDILTHFVDIYVPAKLTTTSPQEWPAEPCAEWNGPEDDEELLNKMLGSKSANAVFGGGASFNDLWTANAEALGKVYPSTNRAYDASSADAALAQHLAFWTGKNAGRMKKLMLRSALRREKWNRVDYLDRTIKKACTQQEKVYQPNQPATANPLNNNAPETPTSDSTLWREVSIADILTNPPPPPRFLIDSLLPAGVLTLLGAHGGTGKSMLSLQAAVCLATGQRFMGKTIQKSRVLFFSAEDAGSTIRHRLARICNQLSIDPAELLTNLKIIDATSNPCLYTAIGNCPESAITTGGYHELKRIAEAFCADVIIIDNASDTFDANENERARVREFVRQLIQLGTAQHTAILLLAHIDKQTAKAGSSEGYSGSTAWHNSARSRLFLTNKEENLVLEQQKSNFGRCAEPICLRWIEGGMLEHIAAPSEQETKGSVLQLIQEYYDRGDYISPAPNSTNNAYRTLRDDPRFPRTLDRGKLTTILREAESSGQLKREMYETDNRKKRARYQVAPTAPSSSAQLGAVGANPSPIECAKYSIGVWGESARSHTEQPGAN